MLWYYGVQTMGGFWISRYEASGMSKTTTNEYTLDNEIKLNSVKNAKNSNYMDWHRAYGQLGIYSKKAEIDLKSNMIWGSQFDQAIIWLKDVRNPSQGEHVFYVINSTGMSSSDFTVTGQFKVKNIFDLSGGISEWTAASADTFAARGKGGWAKRYYFNLLPNRNSLDTGNSGTPMSSRIVLF